MSVSTTFEYDPAEHYSASQAVFRRGTARYLRWGFVALAIVLLWWNVVRHWNDASLSMVLASALPYVLLGAFWLFYFPYAQRRAARKLPEVDASVRGPQTRGVDVDGFHTRGNGVSLDVPWHAMVRGEETDRFFLFFYAKQLAYYIPKRVLSPSETGDVRGLMREHLGERATLRPT
jgi:hypothetical protein